MKIGIGNDTAGTTLKYIILEHLKAKGFEVIDFGAASGETVEYPTAAKTVSEAVLKGNDVVVEDSEGAQILLKSKTFDNTVIGSILNLPSKDYLHGQVLFGLAYYDFILKQICIEPRSIISDKEILRLAF